jgi:acetylornithine/succinyldiaminopimelate/putrescine aminotransferase
MLTSDKILRSVYGSMDQAMVHSTTFKGNQLAMVAGLATLSVFDDERIVEHAAAMGELWHAKLGFLVERHEFLHEIRGRGQMIGIVFGAPTSRGARLRWRAVEAARPAMFSQTIVVPLFHRYGILTQVAADNVNVIKLLPPLVATETEIDYFVHALDELLTDAERSSAWLREFGFTMARGALKHSRRRAANVQSPL